MGYSGMTEALTRNHEHSARTRNDTKKWIVHFAFTAESSEEMFLRPSVSAEGRFRVRA